MSLQMQFQGGRQRTITISDTAGNVVSNQSPGAGRRWLILGGRLKLVADGNAANRYVVLQKTNGTNILYNYGRAGVATASQTKFNTLINGNIAVAGNWVRTLDVDVGSADDGTVSLGNAPILSGADQLRITVLNGLAGDVLNGYLDVLEVDI